ncbi:MAG: V-type ATP synthase subunit B [Nitrospinae bacterium]|nr:V-type ATP synthase subunit B [Nitrospinota bacterium]
MDLITREFQSIRYISGPLIFLEKVRKVSMGEMVDVMLSTGEEKRGQVLKITEDYAVIQVLEGTSGIDTSKTRVRLKGEAAKFGVSEALMGRIFSGLGEPRDGIPNFIPEKRMDISGLPINPVSRDKPADFIQTGVSSIDGLNTLVRGQKLPIFSGAGLPANEMAAQVVRQASVKGGEGFAVVFGAMGISSRESFFFIENFKKTGAMERTVMFLNLADDPTIERLFTPRIALTAAEYLAFERDMHILVILTDMTNYCEALREIGSAREEIPGRRGYPGYMYTDLASIYERAGRLKGKKGSITLLPILTMPDDDVTHPIPDLTGYITEGQIVLSRQLWKKGVYPPVDVLPSLSRLMNLGIGAAKTREDHRGLSDQLYSVYAKGRDIRKLSTIVGEEGLSDLDKKYLNFVDEFENRFIGQGEVNRSIEDTLNIGWELLKIMPKTTLTRIREDLIEKYYG